LYYTNQERREKILEYVKDHPRTKKRKVIEFMSSKGVKMSAWRITHGLIIDLIADGKIKVEAKPGGRDHHLIINDQNHFFVLSSQIDRYQKFEKGLTREVFKQNNLKRLQEDKYFRDFIRLTQLEFFKKISWVSVKIQSYIKSAEDRQILNLRLSQLLLESNKLNGILTSPNEIIDLLENSKIKYGPNDNIMHLFFENLPHINEV
jgi:hypothetical protein